MLDCYIALDERYKHHNIERVLIADFDVHHGNGTEEIFNENASVFYFSTHRELFYPPGTGLAENRGKGDGLGASLNIPIKSSDSSHNEVIAAFENELIPAME